MSGAISTDRRAGSGNIPLIWNQWSQIKKKASKRNLLSFVCPKGFGMSTNENHLSVPKGLASVPMRWCHYISVIHYCDCSIEECKNIYSCNCTVWVMAGCIYGRTYGWLRHLRLVDNHLLTLRYFLRLIFPAQDPHQRNVT